MAGQAQARSERDNSERMKEINSNGFNMADDTSKVRVEERLKIKIGKYILTYFIIKQKKIT